MTGDDLRRDLPEALSVSAVHAVLADPVRRHLLEQLAELETAERPSTLARNLAVKSDNHMVQDAEELHHIHIPKLEEAGIVATDDEENVVELTDEGEESMGLITE